MCAPRVPWAPAAFVQSGPAPCKPLAPRPPPDTPSRLPFQPASRPTSYSLLSTRQRASAFNQPLVWDTSKVNTMQWMFYVCSARAHTTSHPTHPTPPSRRPRPAPRPLIACPPCDSRQGHGISAFNQLLSFDTSSVTNMVEMFRVRSAPALCLPDSLESGPPLCMPPPPHAVPPPARTLPPVSHAPPSDARAPQGTPNFNQLLTFDTSNVKRMTKMFWVCSARALGPQL